MQSRAVLAILAFCMACGATERRFPLREPIRYDDDTASVRVRCHEERTAKDRHHVSCAPAVYTSMLYWDGVDNIVFRPISDALGVVTSGEAVDVNSLDEVPDSSWFVNRIGARAMSDAELTRAACKPEEVLDPEGAADASWVIDKGKSEGSTPGFRVTIPGKGKYMLKLDVPADRQPERMAAASAISSAIFHAVGYRISCERVVYIRPSILKLEPGLTSKGNFANEKPFDQRALDAMLASATKRNGLVRVSASAWLPGHPIGPFRYDGVRKDDPNDVVPHEHRRELRGMRVLAAWLGRYDAREANAFDAWFADEHPSDASPGHVIHYVLDVSETLGAVMPHLIDPGEKAHVTPGHELFGSFDATGFDPDEWKPMYPNAAFGNMTERDGAWMARILARFTPERVRELVKLGDLTDASNAEYLASVLDGRLARILDRWLTRLSPITDVRVEDGNRLCGVDLAERRGVRPAERFHYVAQVVGGAPLEVKRASGGAICISLVHSSAVYVRVAIEDTVARGPLVAHLYDLGPARGFRLVGLVRPPK